MNMPDFSSASSKIDRATKHLEELKSKIGAFLSADSYVLRTEIDQGKGTIKVDFDSLHEIDRSLQAILGDVISNLRSSLDYIIVAINEVADPSKKVNIEKLGFPFADDMPGFIGELTAPRQSGLPQTVIDIFVNEIQAYKGGIGEVLWALNKLRNIDKHRFLIATVNIASITLSFRASGVTMNDLTVGTYAGQSSNVFVVPFQNFQITKQPVPMIEIRLKEIGIVDGIEVINFLNRASSQTRTVLNSFQKAFGII